jgi:AraC-like DNA-binding protein
MEPTILAPMLSPFSQALEASGCDSDLIFERAGIAPGLLTSPDARVPRSAGVRLIELCLEATGDPCFGLTVGQHWDPAASRSLGFAWLTSETLQDGLERTARYFLITTDNVKLRLRRDQEQAQLELASASVAFSLPPLVCDALMSALVTMCRRIRGEDFNPWRVELQHQAPPNSDPYQHAFRCPVEFDASRNALHLDPAELNRWLPPASSALLDSHASLIARRLATAAVPSLSHRIQRILLRQLPSGHATVVTVARALGMTSRTFQRRLQEQNLTFSDLIDGVRRELATAYLSQREVPIKELVFLLGFADAGAFSRAFKRWTGVSPGKYRATAAS